MVESVCSGTSASWVSEYATHLKCFFFFPLQMNSTSENLGFIFQQEGNMEMLLLSVNHGTQLIFSENQKNTK